ncbi:MAG: bifunctional enoyl-CoA hydratase/phosphate acetyltransferase [Bacteroidales bacterium]|nr:bifunctional enoyl-CoA hydratase/phosphate acetyltransferase [Bacteroidales bacterium]
MLKTIAELYIKNKENSGIKRLVLASAADDHSLDAVYKAKEQNIIEPVLVGHKDDIKKLCDENGYKLDDIELIHTETKEEAVAESVKLVKEGKAEILMKGNVGTATLLRGILNDERGLKSGSLLSHFAFFEIPEYHKLIALTDVAMNIAPTLKEKIGIISNAVKYMHKIGYLKPKVAVIGAVETVNEKMPATIDAAILSKMAQRNQISGCIIDGPLAFDNAMSKESAEHKGIISDVAGDADLLMLPNIEAGNVLYKSFAYTGGKLAAVILGATAPIVLTSRSDSEESKLNSIVLAAIS